VSSSAAPAVTYSQAIAGIFDFALASKSARQMDSWPEAEVACEGEFKSWVIVLALWNEHRFLTVPANK
jgi:hypothetical protein